MDLHREICCFVGAVAGSQSGQHVAFGGDAKTSTSALNGFLFDVQPHRPFPGFNILSLRISINFIQDPVYLFQFQVDNVVHNPLCLVHMVDEQFRIKAGISRERFIHVVI